MKLKIVVASSALLLVMGACSILKKESSEKEVQVFLTSFQASLQLSDAEILKQFDTHQSPEVILSAIRILQNKASDFVKCSTLLGQAVISKEEKGISVTVPLLLHTEVTNEDKETSLVLWLKPEKDSFVITEVEGEEFYKEFTSLRNMFQFEEERMREVKSREVFHARAKVLQQKFDSVIWFVTYKAETYYYVVNGTWDAKNFSKHYGEYTLGVVDEDGNVVIPVEYSLVGTIGFDRPWYVEVKKDGKVGYFDIQANKVVIEPRYDLIIPYSQDEVSFIVKTDSTVGYINNQFVYTEGFPSKKAKTYVDNFEFLAKELRLQNGVQAMCEIPNEDGVGGGVVMPPSYLVKTGIFREIENGLSTTTTPMSAWTEYTETKGSVLQTITDNLHALVTTITDRYIEGREEFYTYNRLAFVNAHHDTLAVASVSGNSAVDIKQVSPGLLQIAAVATNEYIDADAYEELDVPEYTYFALGENLTVTRLTSDRAYPQTEFVRLDSSYLSGNFRHYNEATQTWEPSHFLSASSLETMRDEILAHYGMMFIDKEGKEYREYYGDWYKPRYTERKQFEEQLTDIDRYNVMFLDKVIALLTEKQKPSA